MASEERIPNDMENSAEGMQQDSGATTQTTDTPTPSGGQSNNNRNNSAEEENRNGQENDIMKSDPDVDQSGIDRQDSYSDLTLDTLPSEIFLHMCSFLNARFVIHTLSKVCRSFYYLIMDHKFWKVLIAKRWPRKYPAIPG